MIHTIKAYPPVGHHTPDGCVFGYFETRAQAVDAVARNACDMHECLYDELVIEAVPPGIHGLAQDEAWFYYSNGAWHPCARPAWAEGVVNHAMG